MNSRERFVKTLTGEEVDRVPFIPLFGTGYHTVPQWEKDVPGIKKNIRELMKYDSVYRGWQVTPVNAYLSSVPPTVVIEETETKIVRRQGSGMVEIIVKGEDEDYGQCTIEWPVKNKKDWERVRNLHLQADDPSRFPKNWQDYVKEYKNRDYPLQLTHRGVYGFARLMMGDENLSYAFYDEPDLVHSIMDTYTDTMIKLWGKMVKETEFDLIECWEDMAYKSGSMISPETFREFMKPNYEKLSAFAKQNGIKIILVDCDGYIEDLTGLMLESGVTAMYPFEVQAGNNLERVLDKYPAVGTFGGLDKNSMSKGRKEIDIELVKAKKLIEKGRFIPGPDHGVLSDASFENFKYFNEELRKIVLSTKPGFNT
ncbi:MAG: uroporphyrinogen decarboxylase family protein [Candidatus Firestonebacteria bacterium]